MLLGEIKSIAEPLKAFIENNKKDPVTLGECEKTACFECKHNQDFEVKRKYTWTKCKKYRKLRKQNMFTGIKNV